ncbi:MAG TPA: 3-hydroxyacyl-CoA dehydrogenase/enoyl-CoA hydratase family protein, partial [Saprospiraceae bacterium]|nr:3-hydroxyacyl-CoA dehydrogenase/enoyl-CoA hydratase family protein [Saprospiraceae bacterium]
MRRIKNIAVLGSGVMGSGIACHLANAGFEVLMLDMSSDGADRNQIANTALNRALKSSPAPLYSKKFRNRIHTGNFDDDLSRIKNVDWVIEVVKEDLNIKRLIFNKIDAVRKPGTIITSNTSGIPVSLMVEGMSDDFKKHFCITHFFNPPRYLALLEIIPGTDTDPEIIEFLMVFGNKILGKRTVLGKDTPAFIANRIGVFSMGKAFQLTKELGLTIQSVDKLTGVAIGRPKTGTFRLGDLVGLDTAMAVLNGIRRNCPDDALAGDGEIPEFFARLIENNWLGDKTGRGFYQKTGEKDAKGKPVILGYNLNTFEYEADPGQKLESLDTSKQIDDPEKRIRVLFDYKDAGGLFVRKSLAYTFIYAALRIPEIADNLYSIDDAMRAGFAWDYGPFQYWDIVGLDKGIEAIRELGLEVPEWVVLMKESGNTTFYRNDAGIISFYDPNSRSYKALPGAEKSIQLNLLADQKVVYKNDEIRLWDIGDDVLCLEFTSKMNAIGGGILNGIQDAITLAEEGNWRGIVIGNNSKNFTVGANLMMIAMLAYEQEFDQLNMAVDLFQKTTMRCRYSKIPVVAATQGYVFGGGCEMVMHCDATAVAAE